MNEKEVIMLLKNAGSSVPNEAMERCIDSLPNVKRRTNLLPLIKIQICSLPVSTYITVLVAVVLQLILSVYVRPRNVLFFTGISSALIAMMFGWHFLFSYVGSMTEIERTCKYSYGQILLTRVLCVGALTLVEMLLIVLPGAGVSQRGIPFLIAAVLPTMIGAVAALLTTDIVENSNVSQMIIYMVAAVITSLLLEFMIELSVFVLVSLLLATCTMLYIQTKKQVNRRIYYET